MNKEKYYGENESDETGMKCFNKEMEFKLIKSTRKYI
jgi:hypothetical protein